MRNNPLNAGAGLWAPVIIFSIAVNLLLLTGPLFMLQVYDRVLAARSGATLTALFLLVMALYAALGLLDYARGRIMARIAARLRQELDDPVFRAGLSRGDSAPATFRDLEALQALLSAPAALALLDLPWSPLFATLLFIFHPLLGWLGLAGAAVLIFATLANQWLTTRATDQVSGLTRRAEMLVLESRACHEVVQTLGMQNALAGRWQALRQHALTPTLVASDRAGALTAFSRAFRLFLQSAMLAAGAWLVLQGSLTAGAMIAGSILLGRALAPVDQVLAGWALIRRGWAGRAALRALIAERGGDTLQGARPPQPTTLPAPGSRLEVQALTLRMPGQNAPVLNRVSFAIGPGQALGVIGKSGSGKTALARALTGLWPPSGGTIRLGGAALAQYDDAARARTIGYLPQRVTFFSGSVAENIARMDASPDSAAVVAAAKQAQAHALILSLPDGYDTMIDAANPPISGGQQQRIALARALYGDPDILILDEPNAALDADGSDALNAVIGAARAAGKAVIVMTHRPPAISQCDRLIVLEGGAIRAEGPRDEVLKATVKNATGIHRAAGAGA